jgi:hypothetical protein
MDKQTKFWIILFSALLAAGCGAFLLLQTLRAGGNTANIYSDGVLVETIDLDAVAAPYDLVVAAPDGGSNTVHVEHGRIAVTAADCPDKLCVQQGYIADDLIPIVCLPHRLVIEIEVAP